MIRLLFTGAVMAMMTVIGSQSPVFADQRDPRLDALFERLQAPETGSEEASTITLQIWQKWLQSDDEAVSELMALGIEAMNRFALPEAVEIFSEVIERAPDFAEGWNKRATVYYMMREFDRSTEDVVRTLELEPRHFGALSGQGMIYLQINRNRAALEFFRRALEVNPWMEAVRVNVEVLTRELEGNII